jgi:hypothetical protein
MVIHLGTICRFLWIEVLRIVPSFRRAGGSMQRSEQYLESAGYCAQLAEHAPDGPTHKRYKRMEAAWRALAEEQAWLDGEVPPVRIAVTQDTRKTPFL